MNTLVDMAGSKMIDYFETREAAELKNVDILNRFNAMFLSLCKQINSSIGLEDAQLLLPLLEKNENGTLLRFHKHCRAMVKPFFYGDAAFFTTGPIVPVQKLTTLSSESQQAVWRFTRRLYYLAMVYVRNQPLGGLPGSAMIASFLPKDFKINTFCKNKCREVMKNPSEAMGSMWKAASETFSKAGYSVGDLKQMAQSAIATHLGPGVMEDLKPVLSQLEEGAEIAASALSASTDSAGKKAASSSKAPKKKK